MEKKMEEMIPRMERSKSLMEKAEKEEGGDDPMDGEMEESNGDEEGRDDPPGLERWKSLMEKK